MEAAGKGILAGLAYGMLLGPLFFVSLRVTLKQGWRHGVALVGGAFASDAALVLGGWWSAARLAAIAQQESFHLIFGSIGALLLIGFGLSALLRRHPGDKDDAAGQTVQVRRRYLFLQGFLLNFANPSNWLFWLGLAVAASADQLLGGKGDAAIFLLSSLIVVFSTDLIKVFLANRIGKKLTHRTTDKIVRLAGVILICIGVWVQAGLLRNFF